MADRVQKLQQQIKLGDALLLSSSADIHYFSGFSFLVPSEREALMVITAHSAHLLYASFSPVTKSSTLQYHPGCYPQQLTDVLMMIQNKEQITQLHIDESTLFVSELRAVENVTGLTRIPLTRELIWQFRMIKDQTEQQNIRNACQATRSAVTTTLHSLRVGMSEITVATKLESLLRDAGAYPMAFPTIVAFGENTALPHHQPTTKKLEKEMPVLIDVGGSKNSYVADMTRTVWFGDHPTDTFATIENIVQTAYRRAVTTLSHSLGRSNAAEVPLHAKAIDSVTRNYITKAGYGSMFIHTTGHGIGLEIHEQPSISAGAETVIKPGMTLTIEPGIYLENELGYRYENSVLITNSGYEELTV